MIDAKVLLADLTRLLKRLEDDLRERVLSPASEVPELRGQLQAEWQAARDAERTAETFESWIEQVITQAGVHWLLSCVFLRFIEDNVLVDRPWITGTPQSGRQALARDRHDAYFREHPHQNDRDYLITCFREAGALPGLHTFFDETHNPVFRLGVSGDTAMALMQFWQEIAADSGALVRDFTDSTWNTRFLGDLYQDLSEATRKRYALLQTPEFIEEFILDRTLTPAIQEFGFREVLMIDPTCGSGHFLLGGFHRMVEQWSSNEPGRNRRDIAQKALDAVAGVDLNPFAVAISRFRLLVAALQASDVHRLSEAPDFKIHVAIGDSLLHGKRFGLTATDDMFQHADHFAETGLAHAYASEDLTEVQRILDRQYHAVVGNPPYIVVKDAALNAAYRKQYASCHMKYSLGVPFTERFFELALTGSDDLSAGYVGLITANSFMKREFGSKLIEQVLPRLDLTHVVDTSGAYIPGHGTPTVILFGRHRTPLNETVRTVMGIRGEPATPTDPAWGTVWRAIVDQVDVVGSESTYVSVSDTTRTSFARHPWSIGGGGAADLKEIIEEGRKKLGAIAESIGITSFTLEDDVFIRNVDSFRRAFIPATLLRPMVMGDQVRDWARMDGDWSLFPYDSNFHPIDLPSDNKSLNAMWSYKTNLANNKMFGQQTKIEAGLKWWEFGRLTSSKLRTPHSITFAHVATHNHFVFDSGGKVFNRSAPVIKLPAGASEEDHFGLLGLLNSSVACFWQKQVGHNKGSTVDQHGARQTTMPFENFYEFTSTKLAEFPLAEPRPIELARTLDLLAHELAATSPATLTQRSVPTRAALDAARTKSKSLRRHMVSMQEELDWRCYKLYGLTQNELTHDNPPEIALGERAFEIVLARRIATGQEESTWFVRHNATPITEFPDHWSAEYCRVVEARVELIEIDKFIRLTERPEYKRRWTSVPWEEQEIEALKGWLLDRLELTLKLDASDAASLTSTNKLADRMRVDADFMQVAALYAGHADFDPATLVADLVGSEAVPFLRVLRYADTGLRKRAQWEETWNLQRHEDAIDAEIERTADAKRQRLLLIVKQDGNGTEPDQAALKWVEETLRAELESEKSKRKASEVGKIPVPPKYIGKDFLKSDFWRLRGGLDVPKERWISYPGCERGADGSLVIAWAGWDHLQQATALATYFIEMKEREGWSLERLQPLLAGLLELVPWLKQWHNEMNPVFGARMGDYYESFVTDEARALQLTLDDLRAWKPSVTATRRGRRAAT